MSATAEQRADSVRKGLDAVVTSVDKSHFRPMQKESFLCQSRCCDTTSNQAALQACCQHCTGPLEQAEQGVQYHLKAFTERLQRCTVRCQDTAQESLPTNPNEKHVAAAQKKLESCVGDCAVEYEKKLPKLKADIIQQLQVKA